MSHASIRFHLMAASAACALLAACSAPEDSAIEPVSDSPAPAPVSHEDTRPADGVAPPETSPERNAVDIQEWDVQWEGRPRDPYTLDGETVWFVGQANSYIGRLDVATGEMTRTDLREGAGPHNLIVNPDGRIWYAGNRDAHIGIYDPADGTFDYVETPPDTVADPHTQIFDGQGISGSPASAAIRSAVSTWKRASSTR